MKKKIILLVIGCLLVVVAGCSSNGKAGTPASAHPVPESQQTAPGPTTTGSTGVQKNQTSNSISTTSPNNGESLNQVEPSPIMLYSIQNDLKSGNNEFPNYELGNVQIEPIMSYQDWINRGWTPTMEKRPFFYCSSFNIQLDPRIYLK